MSLFAPDTLADLTRDELTARAAIRPAHGRHGRQANAAQGRQATQAGHGHGHGEAHAPAAATPPPPEGVKYDKTKLFSTIDTPLPNRDGTLPSEKAELPAPVFENHARFLKSYTEGLKRMQQNFPTEYNDPRMVGEREFLQRLIDPASGEFSPDKAKTYLKTPEGIMHSMALMDEMIFNLGAGLAGEYASMIPAAQRNNMPQFVTIQTHIDEGRIRNVMNRVGNFFHIPIDRIAGRHNPNAGLTQGVTRGGVTAGVGLSGLVGGAFGGLFGGPTGAAIGTATGTVIGAGASLLGYETRHGLQLNLQSCREVFQTISADPVKLAELRAMTGVNANDFIEDLATGRIIPRGNPETSSINRAEKDLRGLLQLRQTTMNELGVPPHLTNGQTEQDIIQGLIRGKEDTGTVLGDNIELRFNRNQGGILDAAGESIQVEVPPGSGNWVDNINFNPNNLDVAGNLQRFNEARRTVLTAHLRNQITQELERKREAKGPAAHVSKLEAMDKDKNGARYKAQKDQIGGRKKPITERKSIIDEARNIVEGEKSALDVYRQKLDGLQQARYNLETTILGRKLNNIYPTEREALTGLGAFLQFEPGSLQAGPPAIPPASITIDGQTITSPVTTRNTLINSRDAAIRDIFINNPRNPGQVGPPVIPAEPDAIYTRRIQPSIDREEQRLQEQLEHLKLSDIKEVTNLISEITTARRTIDTGDRDLQATPEVAKASEFEQNLQRSFTEVTSWHGTAGAQLDSLYLADPSHSVDDILSQINAANAANPAVGWPAAENKRPERIRTVIQAKADARARGVSTLIDHPSPQFLPLTEDAVWGISEHQLRSLSAGQIQELCRDRRLLPRIPGAAPLPNLPTGPQIERAKRDAQQRFNARRSAIDLVTADLKRQDDQATFEITQLDNEIDRISFATKENLEIAIDFMKLDKNQLSIDAYEVVAEVERFTSTDPIDAADPLYSDVEKNAAATNPDAKQAYFQILRLLTNYHEKPDRDQYLQKLMRVLPPDKLRDILDESVIMPNWRHGPQAPATTLDEVLDDMNELIAIDHSIGATEIMQGFRAIIRQLDREADAI